MRTLDNPFWTHSLALYARDGAAPACLSLQDDHGLDVNVLLLCCWLGSRGAHLKSEEIDRAVSLAAEWSTPVIEPLRAVRRHLKRLAGGPDIEALRADVAALELCTEQMQQARLHEVFGALPDAGAAPLAAAGANLAFYTRRTEVPESKTLQDSLLKLLRAAFPDADEADIVDALAFPAADQTSWGTLLMRDGATVTLRFEKPDGNMLAVTVSDLVVGGWSGRDRDAVQHHIDELKTLDVAPPSETPLFYRSAVNVLMQENAIQVVGTETSGEVEAVLIASDEGLWVTVGSDHTDRAAEAYSVAASKQMCPKVLAREAWPLEALLDHWDQIKMRAHAVIDGEEVLYQEGTLATMHRPETMMEKFAGGELAPGTVMMLGTFSAIGGIRPAGRFSMEIEDPVRGATISHTYDIHTLPQVS